jgi:hypothetical protein
MDRSGYYSKLAHRPAQSQNWRESLLTYFYQHLNNSLAGFQIILLQTTRDAAELTRSGINKSLTMKYAAALILLLIVPDAWAQHLRKPLRGKITADTSQLREVFVINGNTNEAVQAEARGYFTILATVGDTLQFSSTRFKARQRVVKASDFEGDLMLVEMQSMIQLDEVVVERYDHINAVGLGILPRDAKKFTPAERRLAAGDGSRNVYGLNNKVSFDGILNGISGRTAQLKREVAVEKKESLMKQIEDLFDETFFTGSLKIPTIYVKGFLYYIVENDSFTRILPDKNKTALSFLMTQLAEKYKETITIEKE